MNFDVIGNLFDMAWIDSLLEEIVILEHLAQFFGGGWLKNV